MCWPSSPGPGAGPAEPEVHWREPSHPPRLPAQPPHIGDHRWLGGEAGRVAANARPYQSGSSVVSLIGSITKLAETSAIATLRISRW